MCIYIYIYKNVNIYETFEGSILNTETNIKIDT